MQWNICIRQRCYRPYSAISFERNKNKTKRNELIHTVSRASLCCWTAQTKTWHRHINFHFFHGSIERSANIQCEFMRSIPSSHMRALILHFSRRWFLTYPWKSFFSIHRRHIQCQSTPTKFYAYADFPLMHELNRIIYREKNEQLKFLPVHLKFPSALRIKGERKKLKNPFDHRMSVILAMTVKNRQ